MPALNAKTWILMLAQLLKVVLCNKQMNIHLAKNVEWKDKRSVVIRWWQPDYDIYPWLTGDNTSRLKKHYTQTS